MKCKAKSSQTGKPCKKPAIKGGTVCASHGGSAPQVKLAASVRLAALVDPAIDRHAALIKSGKPDSVKLQAAASVLDRAGYPRAHALTGLDAIAAALAGLTLDEQNELARRLEGSE
jgi:hypothetical protein